MFKHIYWWKWLIGGLLTALCLFLGVYYALWNTFPFVEDGAVAAAIVAHGHIASAQDVKVQNSGEPHPVVVQTGRLVHGIIHSQILHHDMPFEVYLPANYSHNLQRYPSIYMLHGSLGRYSDWQRAGSIDKTLNAMISVKQLRPCIVVMPDGNAGFLQDTQWANNGDGTIRIEDYFVKEVVPYIDAHYRTLPTATYRAIGGLSEGGYGAINIALHHPQLFGYVLALSASTSAEPNLEHQNLWANNPSARRYNSPILYVKSVPQARHIHFFLVVGTSDVGTYQGNRAFAAELAKLKIPYRTLYAPGTHSWNFWRLHVVDALNYLNSAMPTGESKPLPQTTVAHTSA